MKILVTGGLGFIGHNVVQKLEHLGHEISTTDIQTNYGLLSQQKLEFLISERLKKISTNRIYKIDIADQYGIEYIFNQTKPDVIIHLASFPRQKIVNHNPMIGSQTMITGLLNLLEASVRHNISKFVYVSSSMVYGDFTDGVTEDTVCNPIGPYAIMKLAGEQLVKDYTKRFKLDHTILRPSAVYGPLDIEDRVVSKFMSNAICDKVLQVFGGNETLDFTYIDDAVDGIVNSTLSKNTNNKTYNITKSDSVLLLEAAHIAIDIAGAGEIELLDKDPEYPSRGSLSIANARKDFGFDPKIEVGAGFIEYYKWLTTVVNCDK